jgi:hypothetical protein
MPEPGICRIEVWCIQCGDRSAHPAVVEDSLEMYLRVGEPLPPYDENGVIEMWDMCPSCVKYAEELQEWYREHPGGGGQVDPREPEPRRLPSVLSGRLP